jgi:hypothetical protein
MFVVTLLFGLLLPSLSAHAEAAFASGRDATGRSWYGSATNVNTQQEASELAMRRCSASGPNCQLVRQFHLGCFAFAVSVNGAGGFGAGSNKVGAESRAITECTQHRGQQCVVQNSICDTVSEQLVTASRRIEFERSLMLQRHANAASRGPSCNLSAKAITYTFQVCTAENGCRAVKSYLEIVGDKVLYQQNPEQAQSGFTFQLGRTVDVSQEASQLPSVSSTPQTSVRTYATASFDGQELTLRLDKETYSRSHQFFPDNVLLGLTTTTERMNITECAACALKEFRISAQAFSGPPTNIVVSDQPCEMTSMR